MDFNRKFEELYSNQNLRKAIINATDRAVKKREETIRRIPDFEELREKASLIKEYSVNNLPDLLEKFKENASKNGFIIHTAKDAEEAREIVNSILQRRKVKTVVKGKSMTSEEIGLTSFLHEQGYDVYETDLGEFIIQLAGEPPSHLTGPAIHKNRFEIARLLHQKLKIPLTTDPEKLTQEVRKYLRRKFFSAEAGITGANFLISDTGGIVLVENEGNIRLTTTLPPLHIAVAGVEKVIPSIKDLSVFLKVLAPSSTGQRQTGYVSYIGKSGEKERHIILLDNKRWKMWNDPVMKQALKCIRCGACANVCPVFQIAGGHLYGGAYTGPIGIIWNHFIYGEKVREIPYLSTLCGACEEVCPVKIPIPSLILELRKRNYRESLNFQEKLLIKGWRILHTDRLAGKIANMAFEAGKKIAGRKEVIKNLPFIMKRWTEKRDIYLK